MIKSNEKFVPAAGAHVLVRVLFGVTIHTYQILDTAICCQILLEKPANSEKSTTRNTIIGSF